MPEIIIRQIAFGADGGPANLDRSIELPIDSETLDRTMMYMRVKYPYIAHSYTFRMDELNGQITNPQPLDKLNSFATLLESLSEYERVKLEGAVLLTHCNDIDYCIKLMHNLDHFDLTPNVSDYEALGRHFAANDFADSLADVPQDMMEHFDYDLLGRMGWDDHTNVFIKGHHIRDTEHELCEPDLSADPLACFMKMRLCSDQNPDGVWIKFPLSGLPSIDAPEQSAEVAVALASLKANSLEECRAVECVSQYPTLMKCLNAHADETLEQILWKAQTLGYGESELGQFGSEQNCTKFAVTLEYEGCSNLDFATDITQNLHCYDFAPSLEAYAEKHLTANGVDPTLAVCFDLKTLGNRLVAENGARITATGVISRNEQDFIFDYYQSPPQEKQEKEIRFFCPLEVRTDPDSTLGEQYGDVIGDYENAVIPNSIAQHYVDEINAALGKEMHPEEQEHGLVKYLDSDDLIAKIRYIWPSVEVWNGELWGVVEVKLIQDLSSIELAEVVDYCTGQMSDGLGESVEQHPVKTQDGDLYVSFWQSGGDYFMRPEQEFKQTFPEQEQGMQMNM